MLDYCFNRLAKFTTLSAEEKSAFRDAIDNEVSYARGENILSAGKEPTTIHVIYHGWVSRYKLLDNGREHIMAYLIPGDMCDIHVTLLKKMDHSIRAETSTTVGTISEKSINHLLGHYPNLARALFWSMMVDESITREWVINLGGRSGEVRIAHFFCELFLRSQAAGLTRESSFHLPINQIKLSETMGLTPVHTNRVLQSLRRQGLIVTRNSTVEIPDWERLKAFADFSDDYLHMNLLNESREP
ncbi:MAG: Crp/Fnr family transcriptional regulator [Salinicola sp.]|uniref:Crp/Fnr family transcriptional regulator n=1 Tax=Salinicola sp. TaxID=1978524 RepID=UPI001DA0B50B|nr:Crp/Fnr family transcriptional regulator [Salinicola sp.]NRB55775.1 Crp/Fnr family transcriptional regulator [Salinicola sp.]